MKEGDEATQSQLCFVQRMGPLCPSSGPQGEPWTVEGRGAAQVSIRNVPRSLGGQWGGWSARSRGGGWPGAQSCAAKHLRRDEVGGGDVDVRPSNQQAKGSHPGPTPQSTGPELFPLPSCPRGRRASRAAPPRSVHVAGEPILPAAWARVSSEAPLPIPGRPGPHVGRRAGRLTVQLVLCEAGPAQVPHGVHGYGAGGGGPEGDSRHRG